MKEEKTKELLSECRLFAGVDFHKLPYDTAIGEEHYGKGQKIPLDGSLLMILSGRARVYGAGGERRAVITELARGAVCGYASLFDHAHSFAGEVRAVGETRVLRIGRQAVEELLTHDSAFAKNIIAAQAEKIRFLNARIASFTAPDAAGRLERHLRTLASPDGSVELQISLSALAKRLSMGRASLYRAFEKLEKDGVLIRTGDRRCRFRAPEKTS